MAGGKCFCSPHVYYLTLEKKRLIKCSIFRINNLVWCSDDNDNRMTFVDHRVYLCPCSYSIICSALLRLGANHAARATNKLYSLQKSCYCPIHCPPRLVLHYLRVSVNYCNIHHAITYKVWFSQSVGNGSYPTTIVLSSHMNIVIFQYSWSD